MLKPANEASLKFPCDCFTESEVCEEPWALIAKRGVFKGGTKEKILNLMHERPRTIAQLSELLELSQPTIHRHLSGLISGGLITNSKDTQRTYTVERYYKPTFPVITEADQENFRGVVDEIAGDISRSFSSRAGTLRQLFEQSDAAKSGWEFEEFAQYLMQVASRTARRMLEEEGALASSLHDSENGILFWATE